VFVAGVVLAVTKVDQFESMFRSASREVFRYAQVNFDSVIVITDLDAAQAKAFGEKVREFLTLDDTNNKVNWRDVAGSDFQTAGELLSLVESTKPSLICTYRNLHSSAWRWPYSLGTHVDLLTQHTDVPIMLLPHPKANLSAAHAYENTDAVMAITSHLTGDDRLINYALRFVDPNGKLWLSHIEDNATFDRYIEAISKIPAIDTDTTRIALREQLLKEPRDYIEGCVETLREAGIHFNIENLVLFGHQLSQYKRLIQQHEVDLLVLNTKDDNQLAMHGMAYALAVELRHIPLLML